MSAEGQAEDGATRRLMAEMYHRVLRKPREGTISAATRCHWQACGFVAFALDVGPDEVAEAVNRVGLWPHNDETGVQS